jgi:hypothetical protein
MLSSVYVNRMISYDNVSLQELQEHRDIAVDITLILTVMSNDSQMSKIDPLNN